MKIIVEHCEVGHAAILEIVTETGGTYRIEVDESFGVRQGEIDSAMIKVWHDEESIYESVHESRHAQFVLSRRSAS